MFMIVEWRPYHLLNVAVRATQQQPSACQLKIEAEYTSKLLLLTYEWSVLTLKQFGVCKTENVKPVNFRLILDYPLDSGLYLDILINFVRFKMFEDELKWSLGMGIVVVVDSRVLMLMGCQVGLLIFQLDALVKPGGAFLHLSSWHCKALSDPITHPAAHEHVCICVSEGMHVQNIPTLGMLHYGFSICCRKSRLHWIDHIRCVHTNTVATCT